MDNQVKAQAVMMKSVGDMMFGVLKNIIIEENKALFKTLAKEHKLNYVDLEKKYLKPEYYLPLVLKDDKPPGA